MHSGITRRSRVKSKPRTPDASWSRIKMLRTKSFVIASLVAATCMLSVPADAEAGPLLDWFRGRRRPAQPTCCPPTCPTPTTVSANYANGLQPGQCMTTCMKDCQRTVVSYVPHTAYRTCWKRVPVTQYRPVTNSDPCTGCTVTCMRPCTTYTYQMQRVPYTTYRPCYRTETYKVPVTTITNDCCPTNSCSPCNPCNTGCPTCVTTASPATVTPAVPGCTTCGPVAANQAPALGTATNFAPTTTNYAPTTGTVTGTYYEYPSSSSTPSGTITTEGTYRPSQPADTVPALDGINPQSSHRPVLDRIQQTGGNWTTNFGQPDSNPTPNVRSYQEKTAQSPVRKQWNYSPVRLASYTRVQAEPKRESVQITGTFRPGRSSATANGLNGWVEVE